MLESALTSRLPEIGDRERERERGKEGEGEGERERIETWKIPESALILKIWEGGRESERKFGTKNSSGGGEWESELGFGKILKFVSTSKLEKFQRKR